MYMPHHVLMRRVNTNPPLSGAVAWIHTGAQRGR